LPSTQAEQRQLIEREAFLDIEGRSRKTQLSLAKEYDIACYSCPGGGCLLTYNEFAVKLRDLFYHKKRVSMKDVQLLKVGRHFRSGKNKIIVGRNEAENTYLLRIKEKNDYLFEAQGTGSPLTLLQGPKTRIAVETAAELTAYHSDTKQGFVLLTYGKSDLNKSIRILVPTKEKVETFRIA
jgi:predicted ribosome quality control (RQC) complex YloA/Tae2 family protein